MRNEQNNGTKPNLLKQVDQNALKVNITGKQKYNSVNA